MATRAGDGWPTRSLGRRARRSAYDVARARAGERSCPHCGAPQSKAVAICGAGARHGRGPFRRHSATPALIVPVILCASARSRGLREDAAAERERAASAGRSRGGRARAARMTPGRCARTASATPAPTRSSIAALVRRGRGADRRGRAPRARRRHDRRHIRGAECYPYPRTGARAPSSRIRPARPPLRVRRYTPSSRCPSPRPEAQGPLRLPLLARDRLTGRPGVVQSLRAPARAALACGHVPVPEPCRDPAARWPGGLR